MKIQFCKFKLSTQSSAQLHHQFNQFSCFYAKMRVINNFLQIMINIYLDLIHIHNSRRKSLKKCNVFNINQTYFFWVQLLTKINSYIPPLYSGSWNKSMFNLTLTISYFINKFQKKIISIYCELIDNGQMDENLKI